MSVGKTIDGVQKKVTDFVKKNWEEMQAQNAQNEARKKQEQEAFNKSYHSERIKLKAIEGRIKAKQEIFPTPGATEPCKGTIPQLGANVPIDKTALDTRHPLSDPKRTKEVLDYISH